MATRPPQPGTKRYTSRTDPEFNPRADEQPMTFVAALDFTKTAGLATHSPLPTTGRLLFFWDDFCYESSYMCEIVYLENRGPSIATTGEASWPCWPFRLMPGITVPERNFASELSEHVPEYDDECEYGYLSENRICTWTETDDRVLGWAAAIQEEPFFRIGQIDDKERDHNDRTLLLQIELGHASGDVYPRGSVLYFIAPTEDVVAGRFDRVYADYQQS
jgi:uncharacterized protein YwqG